MGDYLASKFLGPQRVDPKIYDAYIGEYDSVNGRVTIPQGRGQTFSATCTGRQPIQELVPQTETQFSVPTVGAEVTFVKDGSGQVTHLILRIQGMDSQAKKIKYNQ